MFLKIVVIIFVVGHCFGITQASCEGCNCKTDCAGAGMFPTPVNAVPTNVITMATAIDGVTLMVQAPGIIAKLKKHGPGNHAVSQTLNEKDYC